MKIFKRLILIAFLFISTNNYCAEKLGTINNPIKVYFTPSIDTNTITTYSNIFVKFMEKETGLYFKSGVPTNYITVVEAFGSNRADIAVINSFGYLLANSKYGAIAKLKTLRHGKDSYAGAIMVRADSGIKSLKDLNGKRFAFTDAASSSGYLFPLKLLNDNKIKLGNTTFAGKHDTVVTMIYQKQVDAGGVFWADPFDGKIEDAREKVKTQFPDIEEKVIILQLTEPIPNDPFIFRKDLPEEISQKFIKGLSKFLSTKEGKEAFRIIYALDGIVPATDKDYDGLRNVLKSTNTDVAKLIK
jgi:phosphonate transport system substrate-binding protein